MRQRLRLGFLLVLLVLLGGVSSALADTWYSEPDPIDPAYLTEMPFGTRSQWIQPWRAYLSTPPATQLEDALGINFNVPADQAEVTAQLLAASGIKRARIEIPWSAVSYEDPTTFSDAADLKTEIEALRDNGIRPLILLNANQLAPGPTESFSATLTTDAPAGSTSVQLDAATAAQIVPGYSGLNDGTQAAGIIFISVDAHDVATLSQPLPSDFPAGTYPATTLLYQPFDQPQLADGAPNPRFEATLNGWLSYVGMTLDLVTSAYGSDNFDVEIWNELSFGSDFLDIGDYYSPLPDDAQGDTDEAILDATVAYIKNPLTRWPDVKVGDGFANQTPFVSGTTVPVGLDAIDKHPYTDLTQFAPGILGAPNIIPLDALGDPDYTLEDGNIIDDFVPTYDSFFPEYFLTGIQTETLIRDLAPITTSIYGTPHGADTAPAGGTPPAMWVTEMGMDPTEMDGVPDPLTDSDYWHIKAKAALRTYVSFVGKGVQAVDLYAVDGDPLDLVDPDFFTAAQVGDSETYTYPGTATGGPVMDAIRRLAATVAGAQPITTPRPLSLISLSTDSDAYQWLGSGAANEPTLYDRDVLMFQPFQLTDDSWVAGVYVMTRDIAEVYNESAPDTDPTRTDLPPENFQIVIGGVDAANLTATATDPLSGDSVPVQIVARDGDQATIEMPVTDSPRMLTLDDGGSTATSGTVVTGTSSPSPVPTATAPTPRVSVATSSGRPLAGVARLVRVRHGIYLEIDCSVRCRVRWGMSSAGNGGRSAHVHSRVLPATCRSLIRVATVSKRHAAHDRGDVVDVTIARVGDGTAALHRRLRILPSLLSG